jgi:hypothetical protein
MSVEYYYESKVMLHYILIVAGFIILFITLLPPTWYVDVGTFLLGALLILLGIIEFNKERDRSSE